MHSPNLFMRKLPAILIYTALIGFTITAITNILHRRDIGAVTMVASCTALLAGALTAILVSGKKAADNSIKSSGQRTQIIAYVGVIIFVTGILLKKKHINGSEFLIIGGLILVLVFAILILFQLITIKRYNVKCPDNHYLLPSELEQYTGVYTNPALKMVISVRINVNGTTLEAQVKGQAAYLINPIEPNVFNNLQLKLVLIFKPEHKEFVLIQNGGYYHFSLQR